MTIKEKIMKIMSLALDINPPELEDIGKKRTAVFVYWSPHCNCFTVSIFYNGWSEQIHPTDRLVLDAYLDSGNFSESLDKIISTLESIKADLSVENSDSDEASEPVVKEATLEVVENSEPVEKETTLTLDEIGYLLSVLETQIKEAQSQISFLVNSSFYPDTKLELVSIREKTIEKCKVIYEKLDSLSKLSF